MVHYSNNGVGGGNHNNSQVRAASGQQRSAFQEKLREHTAHTRFVLHTFVMQLQ
jgi:hypothetical protein